MNIYLIADLVLRTSQDSELNPLVETIASRRLEMHDLLQLESGGAGILAGIFQQTLASVGLMQTQIFGPAAHLGKEIF